MPVINQNPQGPETDPQFNDPFNFTANYIGDGLCYSAGPDLEPLVDSFAWAHFGAVLRPALPDGLDPYHANDRVRLRELTADRLLQVAPEQIIPNDHTAPTVALRKAIIRINGLHLAKEDIYDAAPLVEEIFDVMVELESKRVAVGGLHKVSNQSTDRQNNLFLSALTGERTPRHPVFATLFRSLRGYCAVLPVDSAPAQAVSALAQQEASIYGNKPREVTGLFNNDLPLSIATAPVPTASRRKGFRWPKSR